MRCQTAPIEIKFDCPYIIETIIPEQPQLFHYGNQEEKDVPHHFSESGEGL